MPAVKDAVFVLLSEHAKKFLGNGGMKLKMQLIFSMCDFLYMLTSFLLMEELLEMFFFQKTNGTRESGTGERIFNSESCFVK